VQTSIIKQRGDNIMTTFYALSRDAVSGTRVTFTDSHEMFSEDCIIAAGTRGTVVHNFLNEMQPYIAIEIDDDAPNAAEIKRKLSDWDGQVWVYGPEEIGTDDETNNVDFAWYQESPLAMQMFVVVRRVGNSVSDVIGTYDSRRVAQEHAARFADKERGGGLHKLALNLPVDVTAFYVNADISFHVSPIIPRATLNLNC
jgi:hypothetical protein